MKKIISLVILFAMATCLLASCGNVSQACTSATTETSVNTTTAVTPPTVNKPAYEVLQIGVSDSSVGGNHDVEITLSSRLETLQYMTAYSKPVEYNGQTVLADYAMTKMSSLYNDTVDSYLYDNGKGMTITVGYVRGTDVMARYLWHETNYENDHKGEKELSKDECAAIIKEYFSEYVSDIENYKIVEDRYQSMAGYNKVCIQTFRRYVDGIPTSDSATIWATVYGDVVYHNFQSLGEIDDGTIIKAQNFEAMEDSVNQKLSEIYCDVEDKYSYTHEKGGFFLLRLKDGQYVLRQDVALTFTSAEADKNTGLQPRREVVSFLVYLK